MYALLKSKVSKKEKEEKEKSTPRALVSSGSSPISRVEAGPTRPSQLLKPLSSPPCAKSLQYQGFGSSASRSSRSPFGCSPPKRRLSEFSDRFGYRSYSTLSLSSGPMSDLSGSSGSIDYTTATEAQRPSISQKVHPWAHLVKPRGICFDGFEDSHVDPVVSLDIYRHVPRDLYLNEKFAQTLFPHLSCGGGLPSKLPVIELQTLEDAMSFRQHSAEVMGRVLDGIYPAGEDEDFEKEKTPKDVMPTLLAPKRVDGRRPVLYQIVFLGKEEFAVLEAKDFFTFMPDRLDLHCIVLNDLSVNIQIDKRGFDRDLVSVKDFVWVWTVAPTRDAVGDPQEIFERSSQPRLTAFNSRSAFFFRASQFAFVTPAIRSKEIYGNVLSVQGKWAAEKNRWDRVFGFKAAFEGVPETIRLNDSVCKFLSEIDDDEPRIPRVYTFEAGEIALNEEQLRAIRLGLAGNPVCAVQAVFGSGKSLIAAVMASMLKEEKVVLTAGSNEAVAQIAEIFSAVRELRDIKVLRYVSLDTNWKNRRTTPVDLDEILKNLLRTYGEEIQLEKDREICRKFSKSLSTSLRNREREQFELVETNISPILSDMLRIMFRVRSPDVICLTTSALLNAFSDSGIFAEYKRSFSVLICDEAQLIPEPMFVAMTGRLPEARQIYIGDTRQFSPHAFCDDHMNPVQLGATGILEILLGLPRIPRRTMKTSYTAHPKLNDLLRVISYGNHLKDGVKPEERRLALDCLDFPDPTTPFLFLNVESESETAVSESSYNLVEAEVCKEVVKRFLDQGLKPSDIAIVNFYREQYLRLMEFSQDHGICISTVEAYQNRYSEIVILLTTKAQRVSTSVYAPLEDGNSSSNSEIQTNYAFYDEKVHFPCFLDEQARTAVALSRPRQGLILIGNSNFLRYGEHFRKIIEWAEDFGGVVQIPELHTCLGG
ncbi:hypothetical protein OESDEN_07447 [Oesophagostomum dentatum]|uniref:Helicase ATP-binding domain-containing protein n=1 Tax=Oesophagostomum dentatum TaxID=61180 RepID=A0A0B1TBG3_OESDE|nr:hypothetical protein OESDEN_07447 [Oesophagostomum dentatum]